MNMSTFFKTIILMVFVAVIGLYVFLSIINLYVCGVLISPGNANIFSVIMSHAILFMPNKKIRNEKTCICIGS